MSGHLRTPSHDYPAGSDWADPTRTGQSERAPNQRLESTGEDHRSSADDQASTNVKSRRARRRRDRSSVAENALVAIERVAVGDELEAMLVCGGPGIDVGS